MFRFGVLAIGLVLFLGLTATSASATVLYNATVTGTAADVLADVELFTSTPGEKVNYWQTALALPAGAEVLSLADSRGPITKYALSGGKLSFTTNTGPPRTQELVALRFRVPGVASQPYPPLTRVALNFSGFSDANPAVPDEQTFVEIRVPAPVVAANAPGFAAQADGNRAQFSGAGAVGVSVWYAAGGTALTHYLVFGDGDLAAADQQYPLVEQTLGVSLPGVRFPVAILPDKGYAASVNAWSVGQFRDGVILVKQGQAGKPEGVATVLHETVHAVNGRVLDFVRGEVAWFDEGTAQYVESLVQQELGVHQPELFGKNVSWKRGNVVFTLPSRGTPQELWGYYQGGAEIMEAWTPEDPANREFGYALAELAVRDAVHRNGIQRLRGLYADALTIATPMGSAAASAYLAAKLGTGLRPCDAAAFAALEACLAELNALVPPVLGDAPVAVGERALSAPVIAPPPEPELGILETIAEFFRQLGEWLRSLFGG